MQPITVLRLYYIAVVAIVSYLTISGYGAAIHPKLRMMTPNPNQPIAEIDGAPVIQFEVSTSSRYFGIIRIAAGLALGVYVFRPLLLSRPK